MMEILDDISFSIEWEPLLRQARLAADSDEARELRGMADDAIRVGRPKAAYAVAYLGRRDGDTVEVGSVVFSSRTLVHNLRGVGRVFPLLATCGREMDAQSPAGGDPLREFWWDLLKTRLLDAAHRHLSERLHHRFRLGRTASMQPGSGDASVWPIEQQRELFVLLGDAPRQIGVALTDSLLMIPNKTTSGLLFPTETDFRSCEVCHREGCPSRHASFNETLWEAIGHRGNS